MSNSIEQQTATALSVLPRTFTLEQLRTMQPGEIIQEGLIINVDGSSFCHSLRLAHDLGMQHKNLLPVIRKHVNDVSLFSLNFKVCEYTDASGRVLPAYLLSKDAFTFVTLAKRGAQANQFRLKYIEAFNKLSSQLSKTTMIDSDEQRLIALRDTVEFALDAHRRNKTLGAAVELLTTQVDILQTDLAELRTLYDESGKKLKLASSSDDWHGGPYTVDDLRKKGFMSTDDLPRRKPQYFSDHNTGKLASYPDVLGFIREQMHISRSTHRNPMLKVEAIRNGWCGVFAVFCPSPATAASYDDTGNQTELPGSAVVVSTAEKKNVRPMVFFTPEGVAEIVKRWGKRSSITANSVV